MKKRDTFSRKKGAVLLLTTILFTAASIAVIIGTIAPIVRQIQIVRDFESSKKSYFAAEAGGEDAFYRLKNGVNISFPLSFSFNASEVTVDSAVTSATDMEITAQGVTDNNFRTILKDITLTDGFSFSFAVQIGNGGLELHDNAVVVGNVYSNSLVKAIGSNTRIDGSAVSAGSGGMIDNITAFGNAYAREIKGSSRICGDGYYQVINSSSLTFLDNPSSPCPTPYTLGTAYPGSPDQPTVDMPISDELLDEWEADAALGGTINPPCPYKITTGSVTIGPGKINCDLEVSGNSTVVTLAGTVWVNGNFVVNNNPKFKVSDSVGNKSVPVIVRSASNPAQDGLITLNNNPEFYGSESNGTPNPDSYVMFVSRNTGSESGTGNKAIIAGNNITGNLLLYAPKGEIELSNNVILRSVTAHKLTLKNNVEVHYNIGLAQPLFTSGPGGTWKIKRWKEI